MNTEGAGEKSPLVCGGRKGQFALTEGHSMEIEGPMRLCSFGLICGVFFVAFLSGCGVVPLPLTVPPVLTIASALSSGTVNVAYNATLTASGGTAPYTWSITAGTLPTGLSLSSTGILSGTPTVAGSSSVTIQVSDSEHVPSKGALTAMIVIGDGTVAVTSPSPLAEGTLNVAYTATLAATGGTAPYTWSVASGSLPAGLTLSAAGMISGTPTADGTSSFTVKATDSASTAQSATASLVVQISGGPLAVTTASLPGGIEGVVYSAQLEASGGVPPYAWTLNSAVPLTSGLAFTAGGLLAGMPTGVGDTTPLFTVVDAAGHAASQGLNLLVQPAPGTIPDGYYAFVFGGTSPQGTPTVTNTIAINGTFTVKSGMVLSGFFDANTNTGPALIEEPISGGTLTAYANGLGTLVLNSGGGSATFALAIPPSVAQGKDSAIRIIEFDDADGTGTRGSGVLRPALPQPTSAAISGNFAFLFSGTDYDQNEQVLAGCIQANGVENNDGSYQISGGSADANQFGGQLASWSTVGGSYAVDANGRGVLKISLDNSGYFSYSFYEVSPSVWLVISLDPATLNSPLVSGSVLQQANAPFSAASLPAQSVLEISGVKPTAGGTTPNITLGLATSDGSGDVTYSFDEYDGSLAADGTLDVTYSVDPVTGRSVTTGSTPQPILYIINDTEAFFLGVDRSASSGMIEAQTSSPFSNASFTGSYLGGSLSLVNTSVLNEAGIVAADGDGNILLTTNRSGPLGLVQYQNVAGTYAVDDTGRVVVTTPDGDTRIFYIVSSTKVAYLTSDGGGYLGSFEQ